MEGTNSRFFRQKKAPKIDFYAKKLGKLVEINTQKYH